jgi:transcriptional regulatory protein RtcR
MDMNKRSTVALGIVGSTKDGGPPDNRWDHWRPTVGLCQQDDLVIDRFELFYQYSFATTALSVEQDLQAVSPETEVHLRELHMEDPWDFAEVYSILHEFARSYDWNTEREDYLIHVTTGTHVWQICLFLLTESRHLPARLIQTAPARKRGPNAAGRYEIIDLDLSRYDQLAERFAAERREGVSFLKAGIETRSEEFNRLMDRIEHVAVHSRAPILLTGATGVGKTQLARRVYELRKRNHLVSGDFVEVNCATLRGDAAMSALFGHKQGAFTGATNSRDGFLRAADAGLLFLDEIGELGLDEQAMLLRAIEEKIFVPLGSDTPVHSDFQLLAGTNSNLRERVAEGRFREDLLARIDLWDFRLPSLRERLEDIEPNLDYELERFATEQGRRLSFNKEARERFLTFAIEHDSSWSANFRDLGAAVLRMATLSPTGRITTDVVEEETRRLATGWSQGADGQQEPALIEAALGRDAASEVDPFDACQLAEVLRVCQRHRTMSAAGRELFAVSRLRKSSRNDSDRLAKYLGRFGLTWRDLTARLAAS